eukprot:5038923-Pyramimonas_sp.AAC.1
MRYVPLCVTMPTLIGWLKAPPYFLRCRQMRDTTSSWYGSVGRAERTPSTGIGRRRNKARRRAGCSNRISQAHAACHLRTGC